MIAESTWHDSIDHFLVVEARYRNWSGATVLDRFDVACYRGAKSYAQAVELRRALQARAEDGTAVIDVVYKDGRRGTL